MAPQNGLPRTCPKTTRTSIRSSVSRLQIDACLLPACDGLVN